MKKGRKKMNRDTESTGRGAPKALDPLAVQRGKMVAKKRKQLGLSQSALARQIGIAQPSLLKIETGETAKTRYWPEIASYLGLEGGTAVSPPRQQGWDFPVYMMRPLEDRMTLTAEPTEYIARPMILTTVPEAFGICVWGDDNSPVYKSGDIIAVHPFQPPVMGTDVVLRPVDTDDMRVKIGQLKDETASEWHVKPYNREAFTVSKSEWRCDRIVIRFNRS